MEDKPYFLMALIDEPSRFDTLEAWQSYVKNTLLRLPDTVETDELIAEAREIIRNKMH